MKRVFAIGSAIVLTLLSGCSSTAATEGDKEACTVWSEAEKAMLQTVSVIVELAKDPAGLSEDVATAFNGARNDLLAAYDKAKTLAESPDLKSALETALDADSVVYYDLAGATNERFQASIAAVSQVVATCMVSGVDVSSVLGTEG